MQEFLVRFWGKLSVETVAIGTTLAATGTLWFGEKFWAMVILAYALIAFDTLTRWVYICKKFIVDAGRANNIRAVKLQSALWQFLKGETWQPDYLTSRGFSRIGEKILFYTLAIMVCFYAGKNAPEVHLFSFDLIPAQVFPGFISTVIFLVELSSVNENLILLEHDGIADYFEKLQGLIVDKLKR